MANFRSILLISFAFVSFLLWQKWQTDFAPPAVTPAATTNPDKANHDGLGLATDSLATDNLVPGDVPSLSSAGNQTQQETRTPAENDLQPITVTTDVLKLEISPRGGTLTGAWLLKYHVTHDDMTPVQLFNQQPSHFYEAQSGLLARGVQLPNHKSIYLAEQSEYQLADGQDELRIPLTWRDENNNKVTKLFTLKRGSYEVQVDQTVETSSEATVARYVQFQRAPRPEIKGNTFTNPGQNYSFFGAEIYSPEEKLEKQPFDEMEESPLNRKISGGWGAMSQHYFVAAWLPPADAENTYKTQVLNKNGQQRYMLQMVSAPQKSEMGQAVRFSDRLFVGPKVQKSIAEVAPGLELTVDYGIFTVISKPVFVLLTFFHGLVGNWGWAIILVTLSIKLAFFKLSEAQYKSMARMRKLQPKMTALKERYADDKQRLNTAVMELYKKEKVNPLGGCLPILVQIPVFIALYWVLLESIELRQAPFILWLTDLSSPDPYFVLPIINGLAMVMTQKISPQVGTDPIQQKMMMAMPVVFSFMFAFFQSGLVLYWSVNSVLSLTQQWIITRRIEAAEG
ncbi:MAG: membrane protein insertase YidC [bacterium]